MISDKQISAGMAEIADDYADWCDGLYSYEEPEEEEYDIEEYGDYVAYLIAEATARAADEFMN